MFKSMHNIIQTSNNHFITKSVIGLHSDIKEVNPRPANAHWKTVGA